MGIGRLSPTMSWSWVVALALALVVALSVGLCFRHRKLPAHGTRLLLCAVLLTIPFADFLLSWETFGGGRAHPTIQHSLHGDELWLRWFYIWPVLLLASLVNLMLPPVVLVVWCRSLRRGGWWFWSDVALLLAAQVLALLSVGAILANFPDA